MVDVTERRVGSVIRDAVTNLLKIFDKRSTRFTLILVSGSSKMVLRNYYTYGLVENNLDLRRIQYFASKIRFSLMGLTKPRFGASLTFLRRSVFPVLRKSRRNLVVLFAQSSSGDDLRSAAYGIKSLGTVISVFGFIFINLRCWM